MSIVQPELFFPSPTLLQSLYNHHAQLYIHYVQWCPGDCKHRINLVTCWLYAQQYQLTGWSEKMIFLLTNCMHGTNVVSKF